MKILALKTEDWIEIDEAIKTAKGLLDVEIDVVKVKPDLSQESLYTTVSAWAKLVQQNTKSIDPRWIKILGDFYGKGKKYDGYALFSDKKKMLSTKSMYGDYTFLDGMHIMEVYAVKSKRKLWKLVFSTYNLVHEIIHAKDVERGVGLKAFHEYLEKNDSLDAYIAGFKKKEITDLLPTVRKRAELLVLIMKLLGKPIRITEGFRSIKRQNELYAQGRTKPGKIVTNAKGGESFHQYGVAVDFVFVKEGYNGNWELLGKIGERLGFEWGGSVEWARAGFVDRPHFQYTLGRSYKDFQNGKVDLSKFN